MYDSDQYDFIKKVTEKSGTQYIQILITFSGERINRKVKKGNLLFITCTI